MKDKIKTKIERKFSNLVRFWIKFSYHVSIFCKGFIISKVLLKIYYTSFFKSKASQSIRLFLNFWKSFKLCFKGLQFVTFCFWKNVSIKKVLIKNVSSKQNDFHFNENFKTFWIMCSCRECEVRKTIFPGKQLSVFQRTSSWEVTYWNQGKKTCQNLIPKFRIKSVFGSKKLQIFRLRKKAFTTCKVLDWTATKCQDLKRKR